MKLELIEQIVSVYDCEHSDRKVSISADHADKFAQSLGTCNGGVLCINTLGPMMHQYDLFSQ